MLLLFFLVDVFAVFCGHFKFKFVASRLFVCYWAVCILPPLPSLHGHSTSTSWHFAVTSCFHWMAALDDCGLHFTAHLFICHFLAVFTCASLEGLSLFPLAFNISRAVSSDRLANLSMPLASLFAYSLERVYLKMRFFVDCWIIIRILQASAKLCTRRRQYTDDECLARMFVSFPAVSMEKWPHFLQKPKMLSDGDGDWSCWSI